MIAPSLVAASAFLALVFGTLHLAFTFQGDKLRPRDPALELRMKEVHPGITRQTTIWKAWIGFNATHSIALMLFGLVYGYLALAQPVLLFGSWFLAGLGGVVLLAFVALSHAYFFSTPRRGVTLAAILYFSGHAVALVP